MVTAGPSRCTPYWTRPTADGGPASPAAAANGSGTGPEPAAAPLSRATTSSTPAVSRSAFRPCATGAILTGCPTVRVVDGPDRLTLHLDCDGQPRSTALWRNLRGWPRPGAYRSIGVEPMLGAVFDLAMAGPGDAAVVPAAGRVTWRLTIAAHRRGGLTA